MEYFVVNGVRWPRTLTDEERLRKRFRAKKGIFEHQMGRSEWYREFKECLMKVRFQCTDPGSGDSILFKMNKAGKLGPRLSNVYCRLLFGGMVRCNYKKCPRKPIRERVIKPFPLGYGLDPNEDEE